MESNNEDPERQKAIEDFQKKLIEHRELEALVKQNRLKLRELGFDF
jgi:hypothetical protein